MQLRYILHELSSGNDSWILIYAFSGTFIAYILAKAIYNLYFHPLRSYPGPFLSRASRLPHVIRVTSGHGPMIVHKLHEKYGPVVRIAPNHLSYTDLRAWKDIYGHRSGPQHANTPENPKSRLFYRDDDDDAEPPPNILNASREEHSRLRRAIAHGFSDRAMREQEPLIQRYVDLLAKGLRESGEEGKKPLDLVKWYNWATFDIIGDLTFAESFGCLEEKRTHPFVEMITGVVTQGVWLFALRYLRLKWAVRLVLRGTWNDPFGQLRKGMTEKLEHRLSIEKERFDLFEGLMKRREEWNLDMKRLQSNASIIVAAGSETTASLLTGVTYLLLENPKTMEKLKQEVRSAFKSADEITIASVSRLPYTMACLNEALRRWPPAASNLAREVHKGGEFISGKFLPERTIVEVQQYSMHHSSEHWHEPYAFLPERFLHKFEGRFGAGDETEEKNPYGDNLEALQPFSVGPRNCVGKNLAYAEMRLILARIIYDFDLRPAVDLKAWFKQARVYTVWAKAPLYVQLIPAKR
ncbi:Isotrichodermin C-15 hydroxylase [Madurella mycetomatis]|uniref:Isotrichodermin C-15 hydroxylase n=1 Tax=Madurella mycetomatis TaxID=100816 RepID=A0A175WFT7_9PEZI|nr:Isotrichodermin C-15 hydroxylase [Madurella mycetomatis]